MPKSYKVFFQSAGFFDVKEIWRHPGYRPKNPADDIALLTLAQPVLHIAPIEINQIATPAMGLEGHIVGFGRTGGDNYDYGLKREGAIRTASCGRGLSNEKLVCWSFDAAIASKDSNTCNADSGGGLYMKEGRVTLVSGSTIAGWRDDCLSGDRSFDANVFHYSTWLKGLGLGNASARCGTGPFIDPELHVLGAIDTLSDVNAEVIHSLDVRLGIAKLGVAMNAEDNGDAANDFDLYLIRGAVADKAKAICVEDGPGQFGYCEIEEPAQGPWRILLKRKRGKGAAQITVTQSPR